MKKLYRKGSVHPSPPLISDPLAFLPITILTLAAALSPEDREVLAYLISCSSSSNFSSANSRSKSVAAKTTGDHPPSSGCNCFRCYTSYWVRWDSSPNHQLIHEIIDAFEDDLVRKTLVGKEKKERRRRGSKSGVLIQGKVEETGKLEFPIEEEVSEGISAGGGGGGGDGEERDDDDDVCCEKGSVRRFVSFIGERFWNVWT
ncbi:uncharacterized protein LOC124921629 [Impatiens glandulifera]|uniref:uncharacterized protein LOC124921629 n=1 Tax=Impatiens glandulifera TaxID=253017 RepID=UPI001FB156BC|nr:uncharacterized protein LOC124921629 [Impatiens glandulifera]